MKMILSEAEPGAILYCADLLYTEKCLITIIYQSEKSHWASGLCERAFQEQRKWEIYRAYKDFRVDHVVEYLAYPLNSNITSILPAYLQLKLVVGAYSELVYPKKYEYICSKLIGDITLLPYSTPDSFSPEIKSLQSKALQRFKSIKVKAE